MSLLVPPPTSAPITQPRLGQLTAEWVRWFKDLWGAVAPAGHWIGVPFNAANFGPYGGGTVTVTSSQVTFNYYTIIGRTLIWSLQIAAATIGGTGCTGLVLNSPVMNTNQFLGGADPSAYLNLNGSVFPALINAVNSSQILVQKLDGSAWPAGGFYMYMTATFALKDK